MLAKDGSQTPFKWSFIAKMVLRALLIPHVPDTRLAGAQRTKLKRKQKWRQATQTRQFAEGKDEVEQSNSNPTVC